MKLVIQLNYRKMEFKNMLNCTVVYVYENYVQAVLLFETPVFIYSLSLYI